MVSMNIVGPTGLGGLWALEWAWHILIIALRTRLRNLNLKSQFFNLDSFRDIRVHIYDLLKFVGWLWALNSVKFYFILASKL